MNSIRIAVSAGLKSAAAVARTYVRATWLSAVIGAVWTLGLCMLFLAAFIQEPSYFIAVGGVATTTACMLHFLRLPAFRDGAGLTAAVVISGAISLGAAFGTDQLRGWAYASSIQAFKAQREAYRIASSGFPFLEALARQYQVHLDLADADGAWAATTAKTPYESPASMETNPGYCSVNMNTMVLGRMFGPGRKISAQAWLEGVQVHEFGHCLDIRRDEPLGAAITSTLRSVPPSRAAKVTTVAAYLEAVRSDQTKLWHEAVADIFAVGYWRLAYPNDAAALAAHLRAMRVDGAAEDPTHTTTCWIDKAMASPLDPKLPLAGLFAWADQARSEARCSLGADAPKTTPH